MAAADTDSVSLSKQLLKAAEDGDKVEVERLIAAGADVNVQDEYGYTALMNAVDNDDNDDTDIAELLIDNGAGVNIQNELGYTALIIAAFIGRTNIAKLLIDNGADVNIQSKFSDGKPRSATALIAATRNGHEENVKVLIDAGADLNIKDMYELTALLWAVDRGHTDIAEMLIDAGADLNIKNRTGETALMYATQISGHVARLAPGQARRLRVVDIVKLIRKKMKKNENWDRRKDMISYRRIFRQADPKRKKLTEKYGEEEDVRTRDGPREKWLFE